MPPNGLYPIPRHHLSAQSPPIKRPFFNTMDFCAEDPPVKTENTETAEERAQRKQEKRERKEQKKLKKQSREMQAAKESEKAEEKPPTPPADLTPMTPMKKGRFGPRGPYKKREKGPDGTPVSTAKRKRESDAHSSALTAPDTGVRSDDSLLGPDFLDGLKKTMGDLGAVFDQPTARTESPTELPKKKKGRPPGAKSSVKPVKSETAKASESTATGAAPVEPKSKKPKTDKAGKSDSSGEKAFKMIKTPVPVPSVASALLSAPKKTPVPLPQKSSASPSNGTRESEAGNTKSMDLESEILVAETPPPQMSRTPSTTPRQPPIPFSLSQNHTSSSSRPQKTQPGRIIDVSSPEIPTPSSDNLAKTNRHVIGSQGSVNPLNSSQVDAFTSSNLMRYKQQLSDAPKPRPRSRRAMSEVTSTTSDSSSSTSRSIRDMLLRVPKPYTQPRGMKNPFQTPGTQAKKKKKGGAQETHDEAPVSVFNGAYIASQRSVNFSDEMEYLTEYLTHTSSSSSSSSSSNTVLPCLHKATGCTPKSEQILHLSQSDPSLSPSLKLLVTSESAASATRTSLSFHAIASSLLEHSIRARIPIPLGPITGTWKLYCPAYTASHIDKYGYGLRTLSLSELPPDLSTEGDDEAVYTGRLHVPPRSMAFNIAPFAAPPHASCRTVGLRTVSEGYKLQVAFLGNGYLRLGVDLGLLLFGKVVEGKVGGETPKKKAGKDNGVWELLGVHEKAVVWEPEHDELEVEGKKLFSRYDGV